jgi:hypothetical protein
VVAVLIGLLAIYAWRARAEAEQSRKAQHRQAEEAFAQAKIAADEAARARRAEAAAKAQGAIALEQRSIADEERRHAQLALAQSAVQEDTKLFEDGRPDHAAAYFARALRSDKDSLAAKSWISDLLLKTDWWLPGPPLQHVSMVNSAAFSPDGRRVGSGEIRVGRCLCMVVTRSEQKAVNSRGFI